MLFSDASIPGHMLCFNKFLAEVDLFEQAEILFIIAATTENNEIHIANVTISKNKCTNSQGE